MALLPAAPEDYERAQLDLREQIRAPRVEARNVAAATEYDAPTFFTFKGVLYEAPHISYKVGLQMQEVHLEFDRLAKDEEANPTNKADPEAVEARLEQTLRCYEHAIALFYQISRPAMWWQRWRYKRRNPFVDCSSKEVGDLLGFFFMCRMKSRVSGLPSSLNRPSLSTLMRPTT